MPDNPVSGERAFGMAAGKTCIVVGTALTLINHPAILGSGLSLDLLGPTLLNYLVPFLVAGYSRYRLLGRLRSEVPGASGTPAPGSGRASCVASRACARSGGR